MTQEQLDALNAANETPLYDPEQLYKVLGGDWGNNYGKIADLQEGIATLSLVGNESIIEHPLTDLQAVPFFGA